MRDKCNIAHPESWLRGIIEYVAFAAIGLDPNAVGGGFRPLGVCDISELASGTAWRIRTEQIVSALTAQQT